MSRPGKSVIGIVIARGETLASVAIVRGVFIATARTQLKSVFSKLWAHRQAELVALLGEKLLYAHLMQHGRVTPGIHDIRIADVLIEATGNLRRASP
jgi:hypothetical protein